MTKANDTIAIAATFTAEPLEEPLRFWLRELSEPMEIAFAPYDQVQQQLLDPVSLLARNAGVNVVLVRFTDWLRLEPTAAGPAGGAPAKLEERTLEMAEGVRALAGRSSAPVVVLLCPDSPASMAREEWAAKRRGLESRFRASLEGAPGVFYASDSDVANLYPVPDFYDAYRDEIAHVPFTPAYFAALGTMIVRRVRAARRPPRKVVVLDCDETLWGGVLGEDGVDGIRIGAEHRALQAFVVGQHAAGMLVCLCSRNREEDVAEVFAMRDDMTLLRKHVVAWRLNWGAKSGNLRSLAEELGLGLDSFVFIDDDPVVCAEVEGNCPEVVTLRTPEDPSGVAHFLRHVWAFDRTAGTAEDSRRTDLYREEQERERFRLGTTRFEDFLAGLGLDVRIAPMRPEELTRVAQLTVRTNQFNVRKLPRSEGEIRGLLASGAECLTVDVRDRFGHYGLVGVLLFIAEEDALRVETFLLSCRALGRGVEHRMLARLGEEAVRRRLARVDVPFLRSERNHAALEFLDTLASDVLQTEGGPSVHSIPASTAASIRYAPETSPAAGPAAAQAVSAERARPQDASALHRRIAMELSRPEQVLEALRSRGRAPRPVLSAPFMPPSTAMERELAALWGDLLGIDRVGTGDDFFDLGGHSLSATLLLARVRDRFGAALSLTGFFERPTIAAQAEAIGAWEIEEASGLEIETLLDEVDGLSDEEVAAELGADAGPPSRARASQA